MTSRLFAIITLLLLLVIPKESISQDENESPRAMAQRLQREIDLMKDKLLLEDPSPEEAESLKRKIKWNTTKLNQMMPGKARISGNKEKQKPVEKQGIERYSVISEKNLFFPLGYGHVEKKQEFILTGILGRTALIQVKGSPKSYYIKEGESFSDGATLIRIGNDSVTIVYKNRESTLELIK